MVGNFDDSLLPQPTTLLSVNRNMELVPLTKAHTAWKIHYELFLNELDSRLGCIGLFVGGLKPVFVSRIGDSMTQRVITLRYFYHRYK